MILHEAKNNHRMPAEFRNSGESLPMEMLALIPVSSCEFPYANGSVDVWSPSDAWSPQETYAFGDSDDEEDDMEDDDFDDMEEEDFDDDDDEDDDDFDDDDEDEDFDEDEDEDYDYDEDDDFEYDEE